LISALSLLSFQAAEQKYKVNATPFAARPLARRLLRKPRGVLQPRLHANQGPADWDYWNLPLLCAD
jgi:hypothetical protein